MGNVESAQHQPPPPTTNHQHHTPQPHTKPAPPAQPVPTAKETSQAKRVRTNPAAQTDAADSLHTYMAQLQPFTFQPSTTTTTTTFQPTPTLPPFRFTEISTGAPLVSPVAQAAAPAVHKYTVADLPSIADLLPSTITSDTLTKLHTALLSLRSAPPAHSNDLVHIAIELNGQIATSLLNTTITDLHQLQHDSLASHLNSKARLQSLYTAIAAKQADYERTIEQQREAINKHDKDAAAAKTVHQQQWSDMSHTNQLLITKCHERDATIEQLRAQLQAAEAALDQERQYSGEQAGVIAAMQADIEAEAVRYTEHVAQLNVTMTELQQQLDISHKQIDQVTHAIDHAHGEIQAHHESQAKLQADANTLIDKFRSEYEVKIDSYVQNEQQLIEQLDAAHKHIEEITNHLSEAEQAVQVLQTDLKNAVADVEHFDTENAELKAQLDRATVDIVSLQSRVAELTGEVEGLNHDLDSGDAAYNQLVNDHKLLERELDRVKSVVKQSISQRVLTPVTNTI